MVYSHPGKSHTSGWSNSARGFDILALGTGLPTTLILKRSPAGGGVVEVEGTAVDVDAAAAAARVTGLTGFTVWGAAVEVDGAAD